MPIPRYGSEALHFRIGYTGNRYAGHAIAISVKTGHGYDPGRPRETIGRDCALVSLDHAGRLDTTWGIKGKNLYLLGALRKRLEYPALKRAVREQQSLFNAHVVLIETRPRVPS
jgi:hypothetical protein